MSRGRKAAPLEALQDWYREQLGEEPAPSTGGVAVRLAGSGHAGWRDAYSEDVDRRSDPNKVRLRWPYSERPSSDVVTRYRRRSYVGGVRVTPAERRAALLPPGL